MKLVLPFTSCARSPVPSPELNSTSYTLLRNHHTRQVLQEVSADSLGLRHPGSSVTPFLAVAVPRDPGPGALAAEGGEIGPGSLLPETTELCSVTAAYLRPRSFRWLRALSPARIRKYYTKLQTLP